MVSQQEQKKCIWIEHKHNSFFLSSTTLPTCVIDPSAIMTTRNSGPYFAELSVSPLFSDRKDLLINGLLWLINLIFISVN